MSLLQEAVGFTSSLIRSSALASSRYATWQRSPRAIKRTRTQKSPGISVQPFSSQQWMRQQAAARTIEENDDNAQGGGSQQEGSSAREQRPITPFPIAALPSRSGFRFAQPRFDEPLRISRGETALGANSSADPGEAAHKRSFKDFMFPTQDPSKTSATALRKLQPPPLVDQTIYSAMNLSSRTGRSVMVDRTLATDLAVKLRRMEMQVARNGVRRDMFAQRFHERPGLTRKRVKSERWRKRFKEQFIAMVERVQTLRRKGW